MPKWSYFLFLFRFFYTLIGQQLSVANYWNGEIVWSWHQSLNFLTLIHFCSDPHQKDLFLRSSAFLAEINNERKTNKSESMWRDVISGCSTSNHKILTCCHQNFVWAKILIFFTLHNLHTLSGFKYVIISYQFLVLIGGCELVQWGSTEGKTADTDYIF